MGTTGRGGAAGRIGRRTDFAAKPGPELLLLAGLWGAIGAMGALVGGCAEAERASDTASAAATADAAAADTEDSWTQGPDVAPETPDTAEPPPEDATPSAPELPEAPPPPTEQCANFLDDDEDGAVDCADSDCAGIIACMEDCTDGMDNDADGLTDLEDEDCFESSGYPPGFETCEDIEWCLLEHGCNCALGVDCPDGEAGKQCADACVSEQDCYFGCLGELDLDTQTAWGRLLECKDTQCAGLEGDALEACGIASCTERHTGCYTRCTDAHGRDPKARKDALLACVERECTGLSSRDELGQCTLTRCTAEATMCLYEGDETCAQGWYGCALECPEGDDECAAECDAAMSAQGAYDLIVWQSCLTDLCDGDGDGAADSATCEALGGLGCADRIGSCALTEWTAEAICPESLNCATACLDQPEALEACLDDCEVALSVADTELLSPALRCSVAACGTTDEALTGDCLRAALTGPCAEVSAACTCPEAPPEDCTNTVDDDCDGTTDCADPECAPTPACNPEICTNGVDDDGNGETDCDDAVCTDAPECH